MTEKNHSSGELIYGEYSIDEALEIIENLFFSKIDFHKRKDFSNEIRFGYPHEQSRKRIQELSASFESLKQNILSHKSPEQTIRIQSQITLHFIK